MAAIRREALKENLEPTGGAGQYSALNGLEVKACVNIVGSRKSAAIVKTNFGSAVAVFSDGTGLISYTMTGPGHDHIHPLNDVAPLDSFERQFSEYTNYSFQLGYRAAKWMEDDFVSE